MTLARPQQGEFQGTMQSGYISRVVGEVDPVEALETQSRRVIAQLNAIPDDRAGYRYGADKWSIKQLVGHLTDAERIFSYRLLRIARGDRTPLPGFDENAYVDAAAFDEASLAALIGDWQAVRAATIALVRSFKSDVWSRQGMSNNAPISARALLYLTLGHTDHHRAILEERYGVSPAPIA